MVKVYGTILDYDRKTGIYGIGIEFDGHYVVTDMNGNFSIDLPPANYVLKIRSPMYRPLTQPVTVSLPETYLGTIYLMKAHF